MVVQPFGNTGPRWASRMCRFHFYNNIHFIYNYIRKNQDKFVYIINKNKNICINEQKQKTNVKFKKIVFFRCETSDDYTNL